MQPTLTSFAVAVTMETLTTPSCVPEAIARTVAPRSKARLVNMALIATPYCIPSSWIYSKPLALDCRVSPTAADDVIAHFTATGVDG